MPVIFHPDAAKLSASERWLPWLLFGAALAVVFVNLGSGALFEPDEGRNAEKARQILVLDDWITPHENFYPVIDKPMFFYWLIALAYKVFGVSEWSARLPSALAALGCGALIYGFVRRHWGTWEALWGTWIALSSVGFFVLGRVVLLDMSLTFFLTLALVAFYEAAHADGRRRRRIFCVVLYSSLAAATLIKGLIGVVLPGMIFICYLAITRRWSLFRQLLPIPGALLFLAIVLPWYLQAEAANPGYLRYFLWDEHFGRFAGEEFNRAQPWHYFIWVVMGGLFPWILFAPLALARYRRPAADEKVIYLLLWFILPFLFFSASTSKMPHYVLPILPAASILIGGALVELMRLHPSRLHTVLSLMALSQAGVVLYLMLGSLWPQGLPRVLRASLPPNREILWVAGAVLTAYLLLVAGKAGRASPSRGRLYLVHAAGLALFLIFTGQVMAWAAPGRSAKDLAEVAASAMDPSTHLVFYDTYRSGMAFYLRMEKPIWMVTHSEKKRTFLGNFYVASDRHVPSNEWGKALLDFEEFKERWEATREPVLIVVKDKNLFKLENQVGTELRVVAAVDEYLLLLKP